MDNLLYHIHNIFQFYFYTLLKKLHYHNLHLKYFLVFYQVFLIKHQVLNKIALETNKDLANLKYNLGLCNHVDATIVLTQYVDILDRLLECDKCMEGQDVEEIVSTIKNKLN